MIWLLITWALCLVCWLAGFQFGRMIERHKWFQRLVDQTPVPEWDLLPRKDK